LATFFLPLPLDFSPFRLCFVAVMCDWPGDEPEVE